ncbi:hypothetical protein, partial [Bacillus toyonensis]|uniref:hypothetical protein n=1 Tax=Bacillus toyonensis TaxID=155322 RepID=UPI001C3F40E2
PCIIRLISIFLQFSSAQNFATEPLKRYPSCIDLFEITKNFLNIQYLKYQYKIYTKYAKIRTR